MKVYSPKAYRGVNVRETIMRVIREVPEPFTYKQVCAFARGKGLTLDNDNMARCALQSWAGLGWLDIAVPGKAFVPAAYRRNKKLPRLRVLKVKPAKVEKISKHELAWKEFRATIPETIHATDL